MEAPIHGSVKPPSHLLGTEGWSRPGSCPPLTIALLPDQNEGSEADEEHGHTHHRLPLIGTLVHLSEALVELNAIYWKESPFAGIKSMQ